MTTSLARKAKLIEAAITQKKQLSTDKKSKEDGKKWLQKRN